MAREINDSHSVTVGMIEAARQRLRSVFGMTPLQFNASLSEKYGASIYFKREDLLLPVHSFKLRGALNRMHHLNQAEGDCGVVTASAGNHAQGVAEACKMQGIGGTIFMSRTTPPQKIERVREIGNSWITIELVGDTFDEAYEAARGFAALFEKVFIHPFNDPLVISGQGTVAAEIHEQMQQQSRVPDFIVVPVGGGGLIAGVGTYMKAKCPSATIVGVEAEGSAGMTASRHHLRITSLPTIDSFVDGTAVKTVGDVTFEIGLNVIDRMVMIPEGRVAEEMYQLRQRDCILAEAAGALSVAALEELAPQIKGKVVVCIISGGNHDMGRDAEVNAKRLEYLGLTHHFVVTLPQRPHALDELLKARGPYDNIVNLRYKKEQSHETAQLFIGLEFATKEDHMTFLTRLKEVGMPFSTVSSDNPLSRYFA